MKKAIFYILIAISSAFNTAYSQMPDPTCADKSATDAPAAYNLTIIPAHPVEELILAGELKVLLLEDSVERILITGSEAAVNSIAVKQNKAKSRLKIKTTFLALTLDKPLIIVSVPNLKRLKITDCAFVQSGGTFHISTLDILIDANAKLKLNVAGGPISTRLRGCSSCTIIGNFRLAASQNTVDGWQINRYETDPTINSNF